MSHLLMSVTSLIHEAHQTESPWREGELEIMKHEHDVLRLSRISACNLLLLPTSPWSAEGKVIHQKSHISHRNVSGMGSE